MDAGEPRAGSDPTAAVWAVEFDGAESAALPNRLLAGEATSPTLFAVDVLRALLMFSASLFDPPNRLRLEGDLTTSDGDEAGSCPVEPDLDSDGVVVSIGLGNRARKDDDDDDGDAMLLVCWSCAFACVLESVLSSWSCLSSRRTRSSSSSVRQSPPSRRRSASLALMSSGWFACARRENLRPRLCTRQQGKARPCRPD